MKGRTRTPLIATSFVVASVSLAGCDLFTGPQIRIELAAIDTSEAAPTGGRGPQATGENRG